MTSGEPRTNTGFIVAETLGRLELAKDGRRFFLEIASENGAVTELSLPTDCLKLLIMTLPQIMKQALRSQHGDESLRWSIQPKIFGLSKHLFQRRSLRPSRQPMALKSRSVSHYGSWSASISRAAEVERKGAPASILTSVS